MPIKPEITPQQQFLLAMAFLENQGKTSTHQALEEAGEFYFGMYRLDWSAALPELVNQRLVQSLPGILRLTPAGQEAAQDLRSDYPCHLFFYNEYYPRAESSAVHARFCEEVYGINLCQHGMMDLSQLKEMMDILEINPGERLLELGCGSGRVAEYISDQTGANVVGIDISHTGVEMALARTKAKRSRLDFLQADMRKINLESGQYDALYCADSLYGVDPDFLASLRRLVKSGGKMAVFWSCWASPGAPLTGLQAENTPLALSCQELRLVYHHWDFSAQELQHWRKKLDVINALESDFILEGNQFLFRNRHLEASLHQQYVEAGRVSRYLYLVELAA